MKKSTALVLTVCDHNLIDRFGVQWVDTGYTTAIESQKKWLYGWLYGSGSWFFDEYDMHGVDAKNLIDYLNDKNNKWLVLEINLDEIIESDKICKFKSAKVIFIGNKKSATDYLIAKEPNCNKNTVIGLTVKSEADVVVVGDFGNAIAEGVAIASTCSSANTGFSGISVVRYSGKAISDDNGISFVRSGLAKSEKQGIAVVENGLAETSSSGISATRKGISLSGNFG
ncbi:MAG: hypothetical protein ACK5LJ_16345, partial [Paracoccus sp. (in: a-proteobacteria)]